MVESDHTAIVPGRPETTVSIPDVQEQFDLLMNYAVLHVYSYMRLFVTGG